MQPSTACIHQGSDLRHTPGVNTPIHPSSAFVFGPETENIYPRYYNTPNHAALIQKLSALEKAETGLLFASGMAAITTALLAHLQAGDHALFADQLYGGTRYLIDSEFTKRGIAYSFVMGQSASDFEKHIQKNTKVLYIESPSNPLLQILPLEDIATLAKAYGVVSMIDNTFASPVNQNPIRLGFDWVIHSGTKYLGGHSDLSFGALLGYSVGLSHILPTAINYGGNLNALDMYLIERSLKTLYLRVERQNTNALALAEWLSTHPDVLRVYYPGLPTHPLHEIAKVQMKGGFGGMLSFALADGVAAQSFLQKIKLALPALSLGGVETLVCSPAQTSHSKLQATEREAMGITDGLLRVSVGAEAFEDIQEDFAQALS